MGARGPNAKPTTATAKPLRRARRRAASGPGRAARVIAWLEKLNVTSGQHAGRKLRMRPWQRAIIEAIYATDAEARRPVRTALVSMARKQGKTTLAAALALCHLCGPEAVPRGQVVCAAADRPQAGLLYKELRAMALANPEIARRINFRVFNLTAEDSVTGSTFGALSSDAKKALGMSPTFAVCDELAVWRNRELLDAIQTGSGAHAEPLVVIISTRSPDPNSPLEQLLTYAGQITAGIIADPTFSAHVWTAPADADPFDPATWAMGNPALGDFRSLEDVRVQAERARHLPSALAAFKAFTLNMPVDSAEHRFINPADWEQCAGEAPATGPCYGGLDLASGAADLTSVAFYWPVTGLLRSYGFIPAEMVLQKQDADRAPYGEWHRAGVVVTMPGRSIDRLWLLQWIAEMTSAMDFRGLACDRWQTNDLKSILEREGIPLTLIDHGTGFRDFSPSLTAFEQAVLDGKVRHGGNPLLRWCLWNAAVDTDPAGNRKLSKRAATGRIDALVAAVEAVGTAARQPAEPSYEFTGAWIGAA